MITIAFLSLLIGASSCKKETNTDRKDKTEQTEKIPLSGHYVWEFDIPNVGTQESHLVFYKDSIGYVMTGPAYNSNYVMLHESFENKNSEMRWVGKGKGGSIPKDDKYFVLFFKEITDNSAMIFKHETDTKQEALDFEYPSPTATQDHGWNKYLKK